MYLLNYFFVKKICTEALTKLIFYFEIKSTVLLTIVPLIKITSVSVVDEIRDETSSQFYCKISQ